MNHQIKKTVLLYGFTDFAGRTMAGSIAAQLSGMGIDTRVIEDDRAGLSIGMNLMDETGETYPKTGKGSEKPFPGRMIVMAGIPREELDVVFPVFHSFGLDGKVPKAMVTPHNIGWPGTQLYEELERERESFRKKNG